MLTPTETAVDLVLDLDVQAGDRTWMVDRSRVAVEGTTLTIAGPDRPVLVLVDGGYYTRATGSYVEIDLTAAMDAARQGGQRRWFNRSTVQASVDADARRSLRHAYAVEPSAPADGEPATVTLVADHTAAAATVVLDGEVRVPMIGPADGRWSATIDGQAARPVVGYRIEVEQVDGSLVEVGDAGCTYVHPAVDLPFARPVRSRFSYRVAPQPPPEWAVDAVIYQVLVDRFAADDGGEVDATETSHLGFAGGTIRGLTRRLDHIAALGATALWVSPLHLADTHAGYDVRDLFAVQPRFGTDEAVRLLCSSAHERGLRVVLDFEASYLGGQHPAALAGRHLEDRHAAWFHWADTPAGPRRFGWYGGNPSFVAVDHHHPPARRHLLDAISHWLNLGVDGFRFDSAHAAPFDFWTSVGHEVASRRPDAFTFAEATVPAAACQGFRGRLGGFLDFDRSHALAGCALGEVAPTVLAELADVAGSAAGDLLALPFLENHDGPRLSWRSGGHPARLELALLLLLTQPGPPVLLYGTEIGLDQRTTADLERGCRAPMPWDRIDQRRLDVVRSLVALRNHLAALRRGDHTTLVADDHARTLAYARSLDDDVAVVAVNLADAPRTIDLPWTGSSGLVDATTGAPAVVRGSRAIVTLPPCHGTVLEGNR